MLVLTRKRDEVIVIGGDIRIRVLAIQGPRVKLGIEAPPEVALKRSEIVSDDEGNGLLPKPVAGGVPGTSQMPTHRERHRSGIEV